MGFLRPGHWCQLGDVQHRGSFPRNKAGREADPAGCCGRLSRARGSVGVAQHGVVCCSWPCPQAARGWPRPCRRQAGPRGCSALAAQSHQGEINREGGREPLGLGGTGRLQPEASQCLRSHRGLRNNQSTTHTLLRVQGHEMRAHGTPPAPATSTELGEQQEPRAPSSCPRTQRASRHHSRPKCSHQRKIIIKALIRKENTLLKQ